MTLRRDGNQKFKFLQGQKHEPMHHEKNIETHTATNQKRHRTKINCLTSTSREKIMANEKLKIADFRRVVDGLNWSRNDISGSTTDEFVRMDVKMRLETRIDEVEKLLPLVPVRFGSDIDHANSSINHARNMIARWVERRAQQQAPKAATPPAPVVLSLVKSTNETPND
ncbi:MAG TPA: hypothetical protein VIE65_07045 [Methylobacter sp.]|jgi:hypothetical protein